MKLYFVLYLEERNCYLNRSGGDCQLHQAAFFETRKEAVDEANSQGSVFGDIYEIRQVGLGLIDA